MTKNIANIKRKFLQNESVASLFNRVDAVTPIKLKAKSQRFWSSATANGECIIEIGATANADEKVYHELLHADLKNNGYTQHLGVWHFHSNEKVARLKNILTPLDNEFQHHKMFQQFVDAGFDRDKFYDDYGLEETLLLAVEHANRSTNVDEALLHYLTFCSVGSHSFCMEQLKENFKEKLDPDVTTILCRIESIIAEWASNDVAVTQSAEFKKAILEQLGIFGGCKIGRHEDDIRENNAHVIEL